MAPRASAGQTRGQRAQAVDQRVEDIFAAFAPMEGLLQSGSTEDNVRTVLDGIRGNLHERLVGLVAGRAQDDAAFFYELDQAVTAQACRLEAIRRAVMHDFARYDAFLQGHDDRDQLERQECADNLRGYVQEIHSMYPFQGAEDATFAAGVVLLILEVLVDYAFRGRGRANLYLHLVQPQLGGDPELPFVETFENYTERNVVEYLPQIQRIIERLGRMQPDMRPRSDIARKLQEKIGPILRR